MNTCIGSLCRNLAMNSRGFSLLNWLHFGSAKLIGGYLDIYKVKTT